MNHHLDLQAMKAQIEDGVPWRDGVLTYAQAMDLIREVERLRERLNGKQAEVSFLLSRVESLMAVMS